MLFLKIVDSELFGLKRRRIVSAVTKSKSQHLWWYGKCLVQNSSLKDWWHNSFGKTYKGFINVKLCFLWRKSLSFLCKTMSNHILHIFQRGSVVIRPGKKKTFCGLWCHVKHNKGSPTKLRIKLLGASNSYRVFWKMRWWCIVGNAAVFADITFKMNFFPNPNIYIFI